MRAQQSVRSSHRISSEGVQAVFKSVPQPKRTMRDAAPLFGSILQRLRKLAGLTLRELEQLSGVANPVISSIENGNRRCSGQVAAKLADALFSADQQEERAQFLYAAAATVKARGVIEDATLYPPAILDAVAVELRRLGVRGRDIACVLRGAKPRSADTADLVVALHGGRQLLVGISIKEIDR